ncbi:amino acid adenylation domain-containing protein [Streptomyces misionensis]|uniref:amino acid adenylation domain-containing protein n=1 Tax=Streptomyces misionensis TaxID=67331 RepID=UPI0036FECE16
MNLEDRIGSPSLAAAAPAPGPGASPGPGLLPLTAYQRDVWVAAELHPEDPQFNCCLTERLTGPVDRRLLVASADAVLARHDTLRLCFEEQDGTPVQWLGAEAPTVRQLDLSHEDDPAAACSAWLEADLLRALPLRDGPPVRATLLVEGPDTVVLRLKAHHLVADGWTCNRVSQEIFEEYGRRRAGTPAPAADSVPVAGFLAEEARYRAGEHFADDLEHHRAALADAGTALFTCRAPSGERRRGIVTVPVDGALVQQVRAAGYSPFAYIAAVLGGLLTRLHGSDDVVLGIPLLNRAGWQAAPLGQLANTLPLPLLRPGARPVGDLVRETRAAIRELQRHERLALGDLLTGLAADGAGGSRQLFDVTLSYLRYERPAVVGGVRRETGMRTPGYDQSALNVFVRDFNDVPGMEIDLVYALDVFDEDLPIDSVARQLRRLLAGCLDDPAAPLSTVPVTSAEERDALLALGRGPAAPEREPGTLHGLFERRCARQPRALAVMDAATGRSLTYGELERRANRVARGLRAAGVGDGDRVAVALRRGPDLMAALFGVLKAGAAYVPVDPDYPAGRITHMLDDSRAAAVLLDDAGADEPWAAGRPHAYRVAELEAGQDDTPPVTGAGPDSLAYVIYTSGSTGRPKGVMIEHRSAVNRLAWMQRLYPVGAGDVLLQKTPVSFDVSVWELFWWAAEGARLVLLPPGAEKDPREVARAVRDHGVTVLHFVPSMLGPFLDLGAQGLSSLRYVFCSGEALPPGHVERFARAFRPGAAGLPRLVNLYGPTEAAVDVTAYDCPADPAATVRRVPIGRPVDNTSLYVLDEHGRPQPAGVPGELCIGGVQVARGYLGLPRLTEERFTADPFVPGGRIYRTGDIARWLADGTLEYLGRSDGQVKVRGNRVETGEVAAALRELPGVRDAVVTVTGSGGGGRLAAYYVADDDPGPERLRAALLARLPAFMVPALLCRIDRVPLTPSGKTDLRALPDPRDLAGPAGDGEPADPVQAALARIWAEVLEVPRVGVHDDFYALGGDSIRLLTVRSRAERQGLRFRLGDLVAAPTVAALAAVTVTDLPAGDSAPTGPRPFELVSRVDRAALGDAEDAHPLSRLQLGLIFHSRRRPGSAVYKDVFRYVLRMPWNEAAFRAATARLTARHPVLRATFALARVSEPLQVIHPRARHTADSVDLRDRPAVEAEPEILRYVEERRTHDYDFEHGPLWFLRAYVRPDTVELVLSFHHALLDGASVANLLRDLLRDYAHALGLGTGPVPGRPLPSPAAHVAAERAALGSAESRAYWRDVVRGADAPRIAGTRAHRPPTGGEQIVCHRDLPAGLADALRTAARTHGTPVKSVLLAAHCLTLGLFTGAPEVLTGLITHGRTGEGGEDALGLFLNTVPLRLPASGAGWFDLAREALRRERASFPHRRYPLSAIQEENPRSPLETAFNYVHFRQLTEVLTLPDIRLLDFRTWEETNFALLVNVLHDPVDGRIGLRVDCDGQVFDRDQAELLADTLVAVVRRMVEHPLEQAGFDFLAPAPGRPRPAPANPECVTDAFLAQAARTPQATALVHGTGTWSYARLAGTARAVAHTLRADGVCRGDRIGVAMDRGPRTVAVVLGVLLAGAAVVPLDPAYPPSRLAAMAATARPRRIVATARHAHLVADCAPLLSAESLTAAGELGPDTGDFAGPDPLDTAYVLFTSGSTGVPKGVAMPHRALANLVGWQNRVPSGAVGGRTLHFAPLSFDVSFQEIFSTLCGGGTLVLTDEDQRRDMPALLRLLDEAAVERVFLPFVALQQMAEAADALGLVPRRLRVVVSSGEQLRVTGALRRFLAALPGVLLENQYGPTESHVVTRHSMTGDPAAFPELPPVGRPVDGAQVLVLDARMRPVPPGVQGEMYLGGVCLAQGYEGRDDLTAERFVAHPYGAPGDVLYRTGDLAIVLPGGDIVCTGRADGQVKIRGYRVEPAEVEAAVLGFAADRPGIREVAVVPRRRADGENTLAAFLVGDRDRADTGELLRHLRTVLPSYLVPSSLTWIPALPLTPSGKRDDRALAATAPAREARPRGARPAPGSHEAVLAETLADLLELPADAIGVDDDLFDLGGTSLTAMRLMVTIEQRYGVVVPLSEFIAAPTVAGLARRLRRGNASVTFDPLVPIRPEGDRRPLFMVHPMGGNVLCYVQLARHLPEGLPLYGLQAAGADPGAEPRRSVPELAADYIAAMRRVQPHGPYTIGGWSFGGFVAFEMALQLARAGEEVADLVLLDTTVLAPGHRARSDENALLGWFFWELLWLGRGGASPLEAIPAELTTLAEKFDFIADFAARTGVLPPGSSGAVVRRLFRVYEANWNAALEYRPEVPDQDITLVLATDPLPEVLLAMHTAGGSRHEDPLNGWRQMTRGRLHTVHVPGDHLSIVEDPHVKHTADVIGRILDGSAVPSPAGVGA